MSIMTPGAVAGDGQSTPLISIGMPVYNAERVVAYAIESICRQTYPNWELLVMDDGSTDRTSEIVGAFNDTRIRVIRDGANLGISPRLNQAIDLATGEYFARMDADDVAYPERLEQQMRYLESHAEIDLLGTGAIVFSGDGVAAGLYPLRETHEEICRRAWAGFYLAHPTWMGRIAWFRRNKYDTAARKGQDQVLLLHTYERSRFACLPRVLLGYRQETLPLRKLLAGRINFSKNLMRIGRARHNYAFTLRAVLEQAVKFLVEAVVIPTGLGRTILRHRALSAPAAAISEWQQVWRNVASGVAARTRTSGK